LRDLVDELLRAKVETTLFGGDRAPRLGRLELIDRIGAGAMGTVFAARDPRLDRKVAVKVLRGGQGLLDEARALAQLQHPNVVAVHDADEADGLVYIVMELAPGESLRAWKPASWRDVARVMREAAAGIAAAHAAGLVHRDIKPDNIRVGPDRTRVVDFGLARAEDDGTRAGTVEYMAPEVLAGGRATAAADQFAFGITLREKLGKDAPRWLVAIADRASAVEPNDRFPSMTAVVSALRRDRRRVWAGVLAVTALGCGAAAAIFVTRSQHDPCASGDTRATSAWSPVVRARVQHAMGDAPWAATTLAALDDASAHWRASFRQVCEARDAQSPAVLDLRMRCLDRMLDRFGALVADESRDALDMKTRAAAPGAIAELAADSCERMTEVGELSLPANPADRERAIAADRALAPAWADFALGDYAAAGRAAEDIRHSLDHVDAPRVYAETLALLAAVAARVGKPEDAHRELDEALLAAARANASGLEADIWARRLRDELFTGDPAKVLEWASFARAAAARAGRKGTEIDGIVAEALRDSGKLAMAREMLRHALERGDALPPSRRAVLQLNLASVDLAAGHSAEAAPLLAEARESVRHVYGDNHPELALYDDKLAAVARARGKLADARALHDRSLALRTAAFGDGDRSVATSYFHRAETAIEMGDWTAARQDLSRALAIRTKLFGEQSPRLGELDAALADVEIGQLRPQIARELLARAAALDPRLELSARRFAADVPMKSGDIPPLDGSELLSERRAAALDARAQLLAREGHADELAALAASVQDPLVANLDVPVAVALAHILLVANDPGALGAYRLLQERMSLEGPSRTTDRVRAGLALLQGHGP
jgi:serine/threonine protein kinase